MSVRLVCPKCKHSLQVGPTSADCLRCRVHFPVVQGAIDFVSAEREGNLEKDYYDEQYENGLSINSRSEFDREATQFWLQDVPPSRKDILARLGDLKDKSVLCIGNGASIKELYFHMQGASLWVSDLSLKAVLTVKRLIPDRYPKTNVHFHAIDALHLPFSESSFDVVYGYAFVHHLSEKVSFLSEVYRVLKPGGLCVFFDDGFSPLWQLLKMSLLRSLMRYVHRRRGISPEDLRATMEGGFRKAQVESWGKAAGFGGGCFFVKREFLLYLWLRGMEKLFPQYLTSPVIGSVGIGLARLDSFLGAKSAAYQGNMIRLTWGYVKADSGCSQAPLTKVTYFCAK